METPHLSWRSQNGWSHRRIFLTWCSINLLQICQSMSNCSSHSHFSECFRSVRGRRATMFLALPYSSLLSRSTSWSRWDPLRLDEDDEDGTSEASEHRCGSGATSQHGSSVGGPWWNDWNAEGLKLYQCHVFKRYTILIYFFYLYYLITSHNSAVLSYLCYGNDLATCCREMWKMCFLCHSFSW